MPNGLYTIYFHSGLKFTFKNKRKAERFQRKLNKYLEDSINTLNFHLIQIYTIYRQLYPIFSFPESNEYTSQIHNIEEKIKKAYLSAFNENNGPAFLYSHLSYGFAEFVDLTRQLEVVCRSRKYYYMAKQLRAAQRSLTYDWDNFETFDVNASLERNTLEIQTQKLNIV